MDGQGLSIFQGAESIRLDTSAQRLEEEEALEDQKRRNEELQNQLENEFGDISIDADDTVDTSSQYRSHATNDSLSNFNYKNNNGYTTTPLGYSKGKENRDETNNLKHLLESKTREYDHAVGTISDERKKYESQINELKKRLALSDAERERANMTRQQTHELLVESKAKISDLDDHIVKLKLKIKSLENSNTELNAEQEHMKTMLSDTQHKLQMVERNVGLNSDRHTDVLIKQANERHSAQIAMMQQQVDSFRSKLEDKELEFKNLDIRYKELQRSRDALLVEKSDTINHLNKNLEESQRHCQNLISKPDLTQENFNLQRTVNNLERQTEDMQKTINNLTLRLETTSAELELMDSALCDPNSSNSILMLSSKRNISASTPLHPSNSDDRLGRLKNELFRSMSNQKLKREEIKKMEQQLIGKNEEIKRVRDDENKALIQMNQYKEEAERLGNKLKLFSSQKEKSDESEFDSVKLDLEKTKFLLKDSQNETDRVKNLYVAISNEKDELLSKLNEFNKSDLNREVFAAKEKLHSLERALEINELKCTELVKKLEREREEHASVVKGLEEKLENERRKSPPDNKSFKTTSNTCAKCIDHITEIAKFEIENLQLQNSCSNYLKEINDLKQDISSYIQTISDLKVKLDLKNERDNLIAELKEKAKQFEDFMRNQSSSKNASTSPQRIESCNQSVATSPELSARTIRENETRIRNEMAKSFAIEVKTIEDRVKKELESKTSILKSELEVRTNELELLKHAFLSERKKMSEILQNKEFDSKNYSERNNDLLRKCRGELEDCHKKISSLSLEIDEKRELIESERKSMASVMAQWSIERRGLKEREIELSCRVEQLELEKDAKIKQLTELVQTTKKNSTNLKAYCEEKEKHMMSEYDRLKDGYEKALSKVEERVLQLMQKQDRNAKETVAKIEAEYVAKFNSLKNSIKDKK